MYLPLRASWQTVIRPSTSFPPPPLIMPYGGFSINGWKSASSLRALPQPVPAAFAAEPTFLAVSSSGSRCIGSRLCPPAQPSIAKAGLAPASMSKVEGGTEEFPFCPRAGLSAARVKHDHLTTPLFKSAFVCKYLRHECHAHWPHARQGPVVGGEFPARRWVGYSPI